MLICRQADRRPGYGASPWTSDYETLDLPADPRKPIEVREPPEQAADVKSPVLACRMHNSLQLMTIYSRRRRYCEGI